MRIILFMLILCAGRMATAQATFGVQAGANYSFMGYAEEQGAFGAHAGVFAEWSLAGDLFLRPGLQYSRKGTRLDGFVQNNTLDFKLDYLTAPILLGYRIGERFHVDLGPAVSYLLKGRVASDGEDLGGEEGFDDWDVGLQAGLGYRITDALSIRAGYEHGLVNMTNIQFTDENGQSLGGIDEGKNRVVQLGMSWTFN
jgi:opacity protein-like surface antigen